MAPRGELDRDDFTVDVRSFLTSIKMRWQIVLYLVAAGICLAAINDVRPFTSDRNSPVVVERFYEAPIEIDELSLARVDPVLLAPKPSAEAQLLILRSEKVLNRVREAAKSEAQVEIEYFSPKFTIVDSLDELNNRVSFLSTGTPSFSFSCVGRTSAECDRIIGAYVVETESIRRSSSRSALNDALRLLDSLIAESEANLVNSNISAEEKIAEANSFVSLRMSRSAISKTLSQISGALIETSRTERPLNSINRAIRLSSIGFGGVVGLVLGILLVLQLGAIDSRIRIAKDITGLGINFFVAGSPIPRSDSMQVTSAASLLKRETSVGKTEQIVITFGGKSQVFAERIQLLLPALRIFESQDKESIDQLVHIDPSFVLLVVETGETKKHEVRELTGLAALQSTRAGVILI